MLKLSPKQLECLKVIVKYRNEKGYSPTVKEIAALMGLSCFASADEHIKRLHQKGYIHREPFAHRGIVPLVRLVKKEVSK